MARQVIRRADELEYGRAEDWPASEEPGALATRALRCVTSTRAEVLWIEDDEGLVEAAGAFLREREFDVTFATDGCTGLELLQRREFDALVLDLGLPRMSGLKFLHCARMDGELAHVPIVVVTGSDEAYAERALKMGATAVLSKPVRIAEVARVLRDVISSAGICD